MAGMVELQSNAMCEEREERERDDYWAEMEKG